jgi:hypothetical protein
MPARRAEDRITRGGMTVRRGGVVISQPRQDPVRRVPVLPPLSTRAAPHEPLSIIHLHDHPDGHGRQHSHMHVHSGDSAHSGDGHPHTPGQPGAGMPSAGLASAAGGGETRDRGKVPAPDFEDVSMGSGLETLDLGLAIKTYLEQQGVNIERSIAAAGYRRAHQAQAAEATADQGVRIARELRAAKRALAFEQEAFCSRRPGSGIGKVSEAQQRVDMVAAQLDETCRGDPELVSMARRRAAG